MRVREWSAILMAGGIIVAGCTSQTPPEMEAKTQLATALTPVARCGQYIGATRQQILTMCDYFAHYGPDCDQIVIGVNGTIRYYDNVKQAVRDKSLMQAPVWRVNFVKLPGEGRYHYDELQFDDANQVMNNRCGEFAGMSGNL